MVVTIRTKSNGESTNGSDSATPLMTSIPLLWAIFPISLDGSTPNLIPDGAENRPVPTPTSTPFLLLGNSSLMA
jgi:hypothetical protein